MDTYFVESGQRRRGEYSNCEYCNKPYIHRVGKPRRFCTSECAKFGKRKRVSLVCNWCKKNFERHPSDLKNSRSGLCFCSRDCKDQAQRIGGLPEIHPSHYKNGITTYRKVADDENCKCGEMRRWALLVHHVDGDRTNNKRDNLEVVCATCHIKRHLKREGDGWCYDPSVLTPRELLDSL